MGRLWSSIVILSQFTASQAAISRPRSGKDAKVVEGDIQSGFAELVAGTVGKNVVS